jgi:hypothetical protein
MQGFAPAAPLITRLCPYQTPYGAARWARGLATFAASDLDYLKA